MEKYQYILFDLDGTLTESHEGIINSVLYALEKKGIHENDREKLMTFVGPPLLDSFMNYYGMTQEEAEELIHIYREYFDRSGWKENRVYEGVPGMLAKLKSAGKKLFVATSKPEPAARKIVKYFQLDSYFEDIGGSTLDETRCEKADVITYVMETLGISPKEHPILMVGDRLHDVQGAAVNRIPCLGVLYGYGSREELETAGAVEICGTVAELPEKVERCFEGLR